MFNLARTSCTEEFVEFEELLAFCRRSLEELLAFEELLTMTYSVDPLKMFDNHGYCILDSGLDAVVLESLETDMLWLADHGRGAARGHERWCVNSVRNLNLWSYQQMLTGTLSGTSSTVQPH